MAKKKNEGEIYYVDPRHVVKDKNWNSYAKTKGSNALNERPVMIGVQKNSKVQVSELTSKSTANKLNKDHSVRLKNTFPKKPSFVDTNTIGKSRLSKKPFKLGKEPLTTNKKSNIKVHPDDMTKYKDARTRKFNLKK